jgi:two-component system chemotaxis response regulator CheB
VAPPDHHLILDLGKMRLVRGPKEHWTRPAVDSLFRSAAIAYGPRVIGVVLTDNLDDGTAGLLAIKDRGGVTIAQDPAEAFQPSMPRSAIESVPIDHIAPLSEIGPLLIQYDPPTVDAEEVSPILVLPAFELTQ